MIDLASTFALHLREIRPTPFLAYVCRLRHVRHASRRWCARRRAAAVGIARPMRRSPSVHNALVLNLRSGDANLDIRGRSPFLALFFSLLHCLSFSRRVSLFAAYHYHCVSLHSPTFLLLRIRESDTPLSPYLPLFVPLLWSSCASCRCCHLTGDLLLATIRDE